MSGPRFKVGQYLYSRVHRGVGGMVEEIIELAPGDYGYKLVFHVGETGLMDEAEKMAQWQEEGLLPRGGVIKGGVLWASPKAVEENLEERDRRRQERENS